MKNQMLKVLGCLVFAVMFLGVIGCGDKVTNITYVNSYYSCVGTWKCDSSMTIQEEYLFLNADKTWVDSIVNGTYAPTKGELWVQNGSDIHLVDKNSFVVNAYMIDENDLIRGSRSFHRL